VGQGIENSQKALIADLVGRYEVRVDGQEQTRIVTLDPAEITAQPLPSAQQAQAKAEFASQTNVDVSSELAMLILLLFAAEIGLRASGYFARRRARA
jgi:hypothetical protein